MNGMGIPTSVSIAGVEPTSVVVSGKVDYLIIDPDSEKTTPTHAFAYNPTYELSFEGIDTGFSHTESVQVLGKTFKITSSSKSSTAGDFKKVSGRGVHYPKAGM